jgi:hypothetical protein
MDDFSVVADDQDCAGDQAFSDGLFDLFVE